MVQVTDFSQQFQFVSAKYSKYFKEPGHNSPQNVNTSSHICVFFLTHSGLEFSLNDRNVVPDPLCLLHCYHCAGRAGPSSRDLRRGTARAQSLLTSAGRLS